jgi:DNA-binding NarL/FixJ family response regulator
MSVSPVSHAPVAVVLDHGGAGLGRVVEQRLRDAQITIDRLHPGPDLVVLICAGPDPARLRAVREAAATYPAARLHAIVPADTRYAALRRVLLAGASGLSYDHELDRTLTATAHAVLAGQLAVPAALARQIAPQPLSHREKQILALIVHGYTNREIAAALYLAESTVKTHLSSAFRKIDARSRSEAVARITDPESGLGPAVLSATTSIAAQTA